MEVLEEGQVEDPVFPEELPMELEEGCSEFAPQVTEAMQVDFASISKQLWLEFLCPSLRRSFQPETGNQESKTTAYPVEDSVELSWWSEEEGDRPEFQSSRAEFQERPEEPVDRAGDQFQTGYSTGGAPNQHECEDSPVPPVRVPRGFAMEQTQILAALAGERQRQAEELKGILRTSEERWQASQDTMLRQHGELLASMQEQSKIFAQILQQTTAQPLHTGMQGVLPQTPVGLATLSNVNLCKIAPGDAPDDFLCSFERIAVAAGWPQEQWVFRLLPCLAGESLAAFQTLGPEQANNYLSVKTHILDYLGFTGEHYRQKFRATQMLHSERPKALLQRITKLAEKWLQPFLNDARALFVEIVKEQLLEAVPKNIKSWIKKQNCKTLGQVLEVAEAYLDSQELIGEGSGIKQANSFRQNPVEADKDWNKKVPCKDSPSPSARTNIQGNGRKCYRCGKSGHLQKFCQERRDFVALQESKGSDELKCQVPVWLAGKRMQALIDTGAEQSVVSRLFWRQCETSNPRKGKGSRIDVRCVHGDLRRYPLGKIAFGYDRKMYDLSVAIIEACPFPLILGRDWSGWQEAVRRSNLERGKAKVMSSSHPKLVLGAQVKDGYGNRKEKRKTKRFSSSKGGPGWRPTLRWVPLSDKAKTPTQAYAKAAGYDIYAAHDQVIPAKGRALVKTDLQVSPPPGSYIRIGPRSGLAREHCLDVAAGIIDPDYRGNVSVLLVNQGDSEYKVACGDKVAQMICERIWHTKLERWVHLRETSRGNKGFGSSGENSLREKTEPEINSCPDNKGGDFKESVIHLQQEIMSLRNNIQEFTVRQESQWKDEMKALREECLEVVSRSVPVDRSPVNMGMVELKESLKQEMITQGQQQMDSVKKLVDQVKTQMQEIQTQVTDDQVCQKELLQQLKKLQAEQELWASQGIEPTTLSKQNLNNKAQIEHQAVQLGNIKDSVKHVGGSVTHFQDQVQERFEELAQVMTAITSRIDDLEETEVHTGRIETETLNPPVLRWPEDFDNLCPNSRPEGKKDRTRKHR
uniref:Uncharacterized protein LOC117357183 n=1 Tax=Geotrypetes seraphini TaxID=260995 RepID=A0A6P8QAR4_GEOSA|nr:uncharacterized protein LOC117357183 [Geotrypetes seraphini]